MMRSPTGANTIFAFRRGYSEHFFGVPKDDWLRVASNRIDPELFEAGVIGWTTGLRSDGADIIALDGKTLRRSGDSATGPKALLLVSAWASTQRLILCRKAVATRYFISSARLTPERAAEAIRGHWGIESMHWALDVIFKENLSRLRRGYGARNMALVRRLTLKLVRAGRGKRSIKTARKVARWNPDFLASLILPALYLDSLPRGLRHGLDRPSAAAI